MEESNKKNTMNSKFKGTVKPSIKKGVKEVVSFISFFILIFVFFTQTILEKISSRVRFTTKFLTPVIKLFHKVALKLDLSPDGNPSRIDIIQLAMNNMSSKKTRTNITVGGMTIGIAVIVFLLSIGYGLQDLVVNRVARLDELRQADVTTAVGSKLKLNDESLATFEDLEGVEAALPSINVVGKVEFNGSATDMAVYGVTRDYLEQSAIKPVTGEIFESNELTTSSTKSSSLQQPKSEAEIAESGEKIRDVQITVDENTWLTVRDQASRDGIVLGYINNQVGSVKASEIWGGSYIDNEGNGTAGINSQGSELGLWLKLKVPLWIAAEDQYVPIKDNEGNQVYADGYIANIDIVYVSADGTPILMEDESSTEPTEVEQKSSQSGEKNEAVVNKAFLEIFQIAESDAVNKTFEVKLIATGILLDSGEKRVESDKVTYTIVGVTPDSKTPQFYVPFVDIRELGVQNFSQVKIVASEEDLIDHIRGNIEALGFNTTSVVDTVEQIDSLFANLRLIMGIVGFVALSISTLGMFNTLTVSLIERTREVGLLKAMGMKSYEIKDLFFAESILMGSLGGLLGLLLGIVAGKTLEIFLSVYSIAMGAGPITIVSTPFGFALSIIVLSFLVGFITGIYPARRATRISALDALRYE